MPIRFDVLTARTATVKVAYDNDFITTVYRPSAISPKLIQMVQSNKEDISVLTTALSDIIVEWDVIGVSPVVSAVAQSASDTTTLTSDIVALAPVSAMYPTDPESLGYLPMDLINVVTEALFKAASPNSKPTDAKSSSF